MEHYTAWLVPEEMTRRSSLLVMQDRNVGSEAAPVWTSGGEPLVTLNIPSPVLWGDAIARTRLAEAGWTVVGEWRAVDTGQVAEVRPIKNDPEAWRADELAVGKVDRIRRDYGRGHLSYPMAVLEIRAVTGTRNARAILLDEGRA